MIDLEHYESFRLFRACVVLVVLAFDALPVPILEERNLFNCIIMFLIYTKSKLNIIKEFQYLIRTFAILLMESW